MDTLQRVTRIEVAQVSLQHPADHLVRDHQGPTHAVHADTGEGVHCARVGVGVALAVGEGPPVLVD
jgi:hypothetical protein